MLSIIGLISRNHRQLPHHRQALPSLHLNSHPSQPGLFFSFPDIDILYIVEERESESSPQFPSQSTRALFSFPDIDKLYIVEERESESSPQFPSQSTRALFSFPDIDKLYIVEERESESSPQFTVNPDSF